MQFWNELEGKVTEEGYRLGRLVRSEGRTAWFETETADAVPQPATISLTESLTDSDEVIARLEAAQRLNNPSLMTIRRIGRTSLDQTPFVYALMEHADQNLAEILRNQPLSKEEARQVAEAMVSALTAIHQEGLVHGRVEPGSILAIGDVVKLRSDCLQTPGGTRAGDTAGMGETLFEAFLQRKPASEQDPQINRIPAPLAEIVRNSLSSRWSLAQVAAVLKPSPPTAPSGTPAMPRPPANAARPEPKPADQNLRPPASAGILEGTNPAAAEPARVPPPASADIAPPSLASGQQGSLPQAQNRKDAVADSQYELPETGEDGASARHFTWAYVAIAVVIVLILGWLILSHKPAAHQSAAVGSAGSPVPAATPASPAVVAASPAVIPAQPAPQANSSPQRAASATGTEKRTVWRVVVYTYHHQEQAQHKADEINQAHSGLNATAYSPQGDAQHCLVVLGGAMDKTQASALRDQAVKDGLPADTYIQNFSE